MKRIKTIAIFLLLINAAAFAQNKKDIKTETFKVSGNCEMCKKTIESSLDTRGVKEAVWDVKTGILKVTYNEKKIQPGAIYKKVSEAGYDSEKMKADDKAYAALPECCKYSRKNK
ncbi:MAG: heavy-metal-associated domain-containing protein [Bacteroidia bacterium]